LATFQILCHGDKFHCDENGGVIVVTVGRRGKAIEEGDGVGPTREQGDIFIQVFHNNCSYGRSLALTSKVWITGVVFVFGFFLDPLEI